MGPLVEAAFVFVGIPLAALATIAMLVYGAAKAARRLTASAPVAQPGRVVAFPGGRTEVVRSADGSDLRKVA